MMKFPKKPPGVAPGGPLFIKNFHAYPAPNYGRGTQQLLARSHIIGGRKLGQTVHESGAKPQ